MQTREKTARVVYKPPSTLPDPNPEPGYTYRWIATHVLGQALQTNVSQRLREGWVPVRAEDHPELQLAATPTGNVEVGGLMLCKIATEMAEARRDYYIQQAAKTAESVEQDYMREQDPRMPLINERRTRVAFGNGS
jgi:hypothetical protein